MSRFILVTVFSLQANLAYANGWELVLPLAGDRQSLHLPLNVGTIRSVLDQKCADVRVACVATVPKDHPKRLEYGEQWYRQCLVALQEAARAGGQHSWRIHNRKRLEEEWLIEPGTTIGAEIICEMKPALVPIPVTQPVGPPAPSKQEPPKDATPPPSPPPAPPTRAAPKPPVERRAPMYAERPAANWQASLLVEPYYSVVAGTPGAIVFLAPAGIEVSTLVPVVLRGRLEIGTSLRQEQAYLWVGGRAIVGYVLTENTDLGLCLSAHRAWFGFEPFRDRAGVGVRFGFDNLWANGWGMEAMLLATRDLTPEHQVPGGKYTAANDLTVGAAVGLTFRP